MIHKHEFLRIDDCSKPRPGVSSMNAMIPGALAGCLGCGQTRRVWANGTVEVLFEGGKPLDEDALEHEPR